MTTTRASRIALAAVLAFAASWAGITVAHAAPTSCSSNRVCVYDNINYSTQLGWRTAGFALQDVSSGNNDKMSSWSNNSAKNACWYQHANGGGSKYQMNQYTDNPTSGSG